MTERSKIYLVKWLEVSQAEPFKCRFNKTPTKGGWIQTSEFTWYFQEEGKPLNQETQYFTI